jgi:putative transcriptional regulator
VPAWGLYSPRRAGRIGGRRGMTIPLRNQIRRLRFDHGEMTQAELGYRVNVTRQTIAANEQGKCAPSLETAFRIARVFGLSIDEVFEWIE